MHRHVVRGKKFTKQSKFAFVLAGTGRTHRSSRREKVQSSVMQRIFTSARAARLMSACAVAFLLASHTGAASQVVDPGWQLVYAGQPGYGSNGLIESMFGDGTGPPVVAAGYQPAPG